MLTASKHTPRSPVNLSAWVTDDTPASAPALANKESLPPDTLNSSKHATTLAEASIDTHTTANLINVAAAQLQPTQQQRKHANRVRNGGVAGAGTAHGKRHVDAPKARQHQPSPSPDARGAHEYRVEFARSAGCWVAFAEPHVGLAGKVRFARAVW